MTERPVLIDPRALLKAIEGGRVSPEEMGAFVQLLVLVADSPTFSVPIDHPLIREHPGLMKLGMHVAGRWMPSLELVAQGEA